MTTGPKDETAAPSTHVWCTNCRDIKPAIYDELTGKDISGHFVHPRDIVCGECKFIIATTYDAPPC